MADRRARQAAFDASRQIPSQTSLIYDRSLLIFTSACSSFNVKGVDHVFDLTDLKTATGLDPEIVSAVLSDPTFQRILLSIEKRIEKADLDSVAMCCHHGRHRSVVVAEALAKKYPNSTVRHMSI